MEVAATSSIRSFSSFRGEQSSSKNYKKSFLFILMKRGLERKKRLALACDIPTFFCYYKRLNLDGIHPKRRRKCPTVTSVLSMKNVESEEC